ncbi:MAG TPA: hypothetical protein VMM13_09620 [Euzebya sp.]|nr:hypothetical protein [Euzebya sp.]
MRPHPRDPSAMACPAMARAAVTGAATSRGPLAAAAVLAWLAVTMVTLAMPAVAAEVGLVAPGPDSVIEGPFEVVVNVRPDDGEVIERVEVHVAGAAERTVGLVADPQPDAEGNQVWRATVDPSEGLALPNGAYRISVRISPLVGPATQEEDHGVRLVVPPPRRDLTAQPTEEDATAVDLRWQPVALPDFISYRIQRRSHADTGTWATVHDLPDPRAEEVRDRVEQPGSYRYRLIVVRSDGAGGELFATSTPQGVRADPEDPGTFTAPPEPDPRPTPARSPTPAPTPTDDGPAPPPPAPARPADVASPPQAPATVNPAPSGRPTPPATPPTVVPFNGGEFEELLPFETTESEMTIVETETAFLDGATREGGTLAVLTEQPRDRGVLTASAAALLLIVMSAHVRRFLSAGRSR